MKLEFDKPRLETFIDAVFAILITIMLLEFKVPRVEHATAEDLINALRPMLPAIASYAISFATIIVLWIDHNVLFRFLNKKPDKGFVLLNFLFLFSLSPLPFTTALAGEYHTVPYAMLLVGVNYALMNILFSGLFMYAFVKNMVDPELTKKATNWKMYLATFGGFALMLASGPLAYVHPALTFICAFIALIGHLLKQR